MIRPAALVGLTAVAIGAMAPIVAAQAPTRVAPEPSFQVPAVSFNAAMSVTRPTGALVVGNATRAEMAAAVWRAVPQATTAPETQDGATVADDILLGIAGGVGGFFGGGFVGYGLDRGVFGGRGGDSPGFKGFLFGAFIGAIALPIILIHWLG